MQREARLRSAAEIFLTFARVGVSGFGGVNFWLRRILVREKRWLTDAEYLEGFALGQIIPGPNVFNLSIMIGHRMGGWPGAFAAIAGILGPPLAIALALGLLYRRYSALPPLQHAIGGMAAVAAGLVIANGVALAAALPRRARQWCFLALGFAGIGVLHWPLLYVMGGLGPFAVWLAWRDDARGRAG
jgi:chromate transporter